MDAVGTLSDRESELLYGLLKRGVYPHIVADVFGVDLEIVEGALSQIHVERHGTDDIPDAMNGLIWTAIEVADQELRFGPPASKARFIQLVLARSIGLAGKSSPETSEKIREALDRMAEDMAPQIKLAESIYTPHED